MFGNSFKKDIIARLDNIEDRLASDRRAVPVLKDIIKILKNENKDLKDRLMARSFEEYKVYQLDPGPSVNFSHKKQEEDLDDQFAGEVINVDNLKNKMVEP